MSKEAADLLSDSAQVMEVGGIADTNSRYIPMYSIIHIY